MDNIKLNLIDDKYKRTVFDLLFKLKVHSKESYTHSIDVAEKSLAVANAFSLTETELKNLYTASLLHDIGKIQVDEKILHKTNVSNYEKNIIRFDHIEGTKEILSSLFDEDIVKLATHHHERLNSSGYPEHLNGKSLGLLDRILQVSDVTSALAMTRSYKEAYSTQTVINILDELVNRGELDKKCVEEIKKVLNNSKKDKLADQPGNN